MPDPTDLRARLDPSRSMCKRAKKGEPMEIEVYRCGSCTRVHRHTDSHETSYRITAVVVPWVDQVATATLLRAVESYGARVGVLIQHTRSSDLYAPYHDGYGSIGDTRWFRLVLRESEPNLTLDDIAATVFSARCAAL